MPNTPSKIVFTVEAGTEYQDPVEAYEEKASGLGLLFIKEIDSTFEGIKLNPSLFPEIINDIRKIQMNKLPFSIY